MLDVAAAIEHAAGGPAFVVGHAFGNRVARLLATVRPDLVRAVSLVAANVGRDPSPPKVRAAIRTSADPLLTDDERLAALRFAFFAPRNDATSWLRGWHPDVLAAERIAGDKTPREEDYAARRCSTCSPITIPWRMSIMRRNTGARSARASPSWSFRRRATPRLRSSRNSSRMS
jgi:pimeloyl-ACP methyl ester carboxylesterase